MSIELPAPIAAYFSADTADGQAVSQCFTEDATVMDEGRTYVGRAAIAAWKTDASTKYTYTSEPIGLETADGKTVVTSHLVGDFPGSPIDLRFFFIIHGEKIASLEIVA